jgi:hypothetical protein
MEKEITNKTNAEAIYKGFELLSLATKEQEITVRDDQYGFYWLLDSAKLCRKKSRFRLIDSGQLDRFQLKELAAAGADLYTSDKVKRDVQELEFISKAYKRGKGIMAYFRYGALEAGEESDFFSELVDLGRCGVYIHLSNREKVRCFSKLNQLACSCQKGRSWLVYYHHGSLEPSLKELGRNGSWIHVSDHSIQGIEDTELLLDVIKSVRSAGTNLVLYVEKGLDVSVMKKIIRAGAVVLFKSSLFDYRSPFKSLVKEARKKKLDFRAYYLYANFLL